MEKRIYTENVLDAPDSEVVCWCSRVSKGAILAARREGATTLEEIRAATKACTLGRCKEFNPRGRCCSKEIMMLLDVGARHAVPRTDPIKGDEI